MPMLCYALVVWLAFSQTGEEPAAKSKDTIKEDSQKEIHHLQNMVITATRTERTIYGSPSYVDVITGEDIRHRKQSRTLPEAFIETPGVMVQKTGHGQGSPYIRGFTGNRALLLIDGIRLNNSTYREGPNQYWNTVDPLTIARLEVVKGPTSVLYGSDAIGGTVNAITRSRTDHGDGFLWNGDLYYRYASAERANVGRAEFSGSINDSFGLLTGLSGKSFGELRGGEGVGLQRKTDYNELDGDFKLDYSPGDDSKLTFSYQRVRQDDAWRTHKTEYGIEWEGTTKGNERKRALDQSRDLAYVQYHADKMPGFVENFSASLSYQVQSEEQERIKNDYRRDMQGVDVHTLGAFVQLDSPSSIGRFTYGAELYHDMVDSFSRKWNADGSFAGEGIQGPVADDATYNLVGLYVQDEVPLGDTTELIAGVRYTYADADADSVQDPASGNEISIDDRWNDFVGSLRLLQDLDTEGRWSLFGGVSQGFRAPNLSDLTRLDSARTNEIETPSPGLDPETFTSFEVGLKTQLDCWWSQVSYYYTNIHDMIVRVPTGNVIDGEDEVTKRNAGDGYIQGFELGTGVEFVTDFIAFANFTWMDGEVDGYPTATSGEEREPISRLMPPTSDIGLRWSPHDDACWAEAVCTVAVKQDRLSSRDEADTQRIPPGGTPGYTVFTLRGGWPVTDDLILSAALENLLNEDYRVHGSGVNEPGRNFVFSVNWRF